MGAVDWMQLLADARDVPAAVVTAETYVKKWATASALLRDLCKLPPEEAEDRLRWAGRGLLTSA